ncbi:MAG TPA: tyrosine recombinase [Ktedonobacteraceae bacterium]|jgi:integrase/recombinase XerD|nr:tyrosine recombinase [Ktedonobacteraceae bacterium]
MLQDVVNEFINSLSSGELGRRETNRNTIVAYKNDLSQACVYLQQRQKESWQQVTREDIADYLLEMRETQAYRPATIARKLASLKSFFRYLERTGVIASDPIEDLTSPRIQKDLPQVLNQEQINSLFRQVEVETPAGKRDFALLQLLYATGLRVSELVALNLDDIELERRVVICNGRRNGSERVLPLPPTALEATKVYLEQVRPSMVERHPDEQALFLNHHGERLTRQGFWLIIKGYAKRAGISEITPHMLRHSFAIAMLQNGMELRSVQELLGHAHIATTQIYSLLVREGVKSTV